MRWITWLNSICSRRGSESRVALEQEGDAALARLAVHADHRLVGATDVRRIDRQVRALPTWASRLRPRASRCAARPFLIASWCDPENAVNTSSPGIRMPRMHGQVGAVIGGADDRAHVGEIEVPVHALREQDSFRA
jgi:hypothetical protein